ncbi:hypothetical protein EHF36_03915 [Kerstersia gyiorum]|nr:hypothetical protein EHF36_03915 [Kerstersia gyiorum]
MPAAASSMSKCNCGITPQWPQRNLFYLARMLSDQLDTGQEYQALKPVVSISLLGHDLYLDYPAQADWHFTLRDSQRPAVQLQPGLGQAMQVHIIELTKAETLHAFPPALSAWIACLQAGGARQNRQASKAWWPG